MKKTSSLFKYIAAVLIYGTIGVLLSFVNASSEFVVLCRGFIGALTIIIVFAIKRRRIDTYAIHKNFYRLIISGIALGLNWVALFAGYRYSVSVASLCNYIAPIVVVALAPFFFKEKITVKQGIFIFLAVVGVLFLSGIFEAGNTNLSAAIYGLLAAIGFVVLVICNRKMREIEPLERTLIQLIGSAATVLPFVFILDGFPKSITPIEILILIILGVVHTGLAYILYFDSVAHVSAIEVAIYGYLEPVMGVATSIIFLGERLSAFGIIGAVLIIFAAFEPLIGRSKK